MHWKPCLSVLVVQLKQTEKDLETSENVVIHPESYLLTEELAFDGEYYDAFIEMFDGEADEPEQKTDRVG